MTPYLSPYSGDDPAADWFPESGDDRHALSFDEWNAQRIAVGLPAGTFAEYLQSIKTGEHDVQQGN